MTMLYRNEHAQAIGDLVSELAALGFQLHHRLAGYDMDLGHDDGRVVTIRHLSTSSSAVSLYRNNEYLATTMVGWERPAEGALVRLFGASGPDAGPEDPKTDESQHGG